MNQAVAEAKPKSARILNPQRMGLAEQLRQDWVVNAEQGTTIEEVLDSQYWAHMASQMQPFDTVEVRLETGEWLLKLRVINTGRNWAQMFEEHRYELVERSETMPAATRYRVDWKGPQMKWSVIRVADSEVVQKELPSKAAAQDWLASHERAIGT